MPPNALLRAARLLAVDRIDFTGSFDFGAGRAIRIVVRCEKTPVFSSLNTLFPLSLIHISESTRPY